MGGPTDTLPADPAPIILRYVGGSMQPTFREGDELLVLPLGDGLPCRGDVIAFTLPGEERTIVHRVKAAGDGGIRTAGDASGAPDPWTIAPSAIRGRVEFVRGEKGWRWVRNGRAGTVVAGTVALRRGIRALIAPVLNPVYRALSSSRLVKRLGRTLPTRLIVYQRKQGLEYQLRLFGLTIGRCLPGRKQWRIRTPFRLVVDEEHLPISAGMGQQSETAE
jgi:signal peptidase I